MADEHKNEQERRVSVDDMPAEVRQLADAMLGVNPQSVSYTRLTLPTILLV